jgi:hypothetical protein
MLRIGVLLVCKDGGRQAAYALSPQERGEGEELHQTTPESMLSRNSFTLETVPVSVAT